AEGLTCPATGRAKPPVALMHALLRLRSCSQPADGVVARDGYLAQRDRSKEVHRSRVRIVHFDDHVPEEPLLRVTGERERRGATVIEPVARVAERRRKFRGYTGERESILERG